MEVKVLITLKWHSGTPDGASEFSTLVPDFDITNINVARLKAEKFLLRAGVNYETLREDENCSGICFNAEIGKDLFHEISNPFTSYCQVEATFRFVWVHRGICYELKPLEDLNIFRSVD
jgi:hypothetical protein